jgi:hypothetical protein
MTAFQKFGRGEAPGRCVVTSRPALLPPFERDLLTRERPLRRGFVSATLDNREYARGYQVTLCHHCMPNRRQRTAASDLMRESQALRRLTVLGVYGFQVETTSCGRSAPPASVAPLLQRVDATSGVSLRSCGPRSVAPVCRRKQKIKLRRNPAELNVS